MVTKANIGGKEVQLKAFSGETQEGLLEGWITGSKKVKFKTMQANPKLNFGFEEALKEYKVTEILENIGLNPERYVFTSRAHDTEPEVFSEISEMLRVGV